MQGLITEMKHKKGIYFPTICVCLGLESIIAYYLDNDFSRLHEGYNDEKQHHKLIKSINFKKSKYWKLVDPKLTKEVLSKDYFIFNHKKGYDPQELENSKLFNQQLMITTTAKTIEGVEFVASVEHKKYPIFATQFHIVK